jgi:hypothetical protein
VLGVNFIIFKFYEFLQNLTVFWVENTNVSQFFPKSTKFYIALVLVARMYQDHPKNFEQKLEIFEQKLEILEQKLEIFEQKLKIFKEKLKTYEQKLKIFEQKI